MVWARPVCRSCWGQWQPSRHNPAAQRRSRAAEAQWQVAGWRKKTVGRRRHCSQVHIRREDMDSPENYRVPALENTLTTEGSTLAEGSILPEGSRPAVDSSSSADNSSPAGNSRQAPRKRRAPSPNRPSLHHPSPSLHRPSRRRAIPRRHRRAIPAPPPPCHPPPPPPCQPPPPPPCELAWAPVRGSAIVLARTTAAMRQSHCECECDQIMAILLPIPYGNATADQPEKI